MLRGILYESKNPPHNPLVYGVGLDSFAVGDVVPENALTNYDSLGQLIDKYNKHIQTIKPNLQIDRSIVELRDAFAHGRISAPMSEDTFSIIKFDKPKQGTARVSYHATMTHEWLTNQSQKVRMELEKAMIAANATFTPVP